MGLLLSLIVIVIFFGCLIIEKIQLAIVRDSNTVNLWRKLTIDDIVEIFPGYYAYRYNGQDCEGFYAKNWDEVVAHHQKNARKWVTRFK